MKNVLTTIKDDVFWITLNRPDKRNAFDNNLLLELQKALHDANHSDDARMIVLNAEGPHFSAGADLNWMKRMADYDESENISDAKVLAQTLYDLYDIRKPTVAVVQGAAIGGGAGLVAACDIAIAADTARFAFTEVKLGLIPAVISPYVVRAIGERAATWLFTSTDPINADKAHSLNLIHHCVPEASLDAFTQEYINGLRQLAPEAMAASKSLVRDVVYQPITNELQAHTATLIAHHRVSNEGQAGLHAFLNKQTPPWINPAQHKQDKG